jgi:hypothetical protein
MRRARHGPRQLRAGRCGRPWTFSTGPITEAGARSGDRALLDGGLLMQGKHLDLEGDGGAERCGQEPEQESQQVGRSYPSGRRRIEGVAGVGDARSSRGGRPWGGRVGVRGSGVAGCEHR